LKNFRDPQQSTFPKAFPGGGWWVCLWLARLATLLVNACGVPFGKLWPEMHGIAPDARQGQLCRFYMLASM